MAGSKVGLTFEKSGVFKNADDVNWCKDICGFPHPQTYGQEYKAWRNAMKRKMEQDRIPGWQQSTATQWAGIQAYAITLQPVSRRSGLGQANNLGGERFTKCLDFGLKDMAKKHQPILIDMLKVQPVAAIGVADPAPTRNYPKLAPIVRINVPYILIQLLQVLPVRTLFVSGWISDPKSAQAAHFLPGWTIQWQTHEDDYWMELSEPTLVNLLAGIDRIFSPGFGYRMLLGETRQSTRLLQDNPEETFLLAEMIRITNTKHVPIWWSLNAPSKPIDLVFCTHRSTNTEDSTHAPGDVWFDPPDSWGTLSDEQWPSSDDKPNSDGHERAWSAVAAMQTTA